MIFWDKKEKRPQFLIIEITYNNLTKSSVSVDYNLVNNQTFGSILMEKKTIYYPAEITFKSFFRHQPEQFAAVQTILDECSLTAELSLRQSSHQAFISLTVTAIFPTEELLKQVCDRIATIPGFMMML